MSLAAADIEAIAQRVAELLEPSLAALAAEGGRDQAQLVDAAELARILDVTPEFVREHADELGVIRLGERGENERGNRRRPRLRFDVETAVRKRSGVAEDPGDQPSPATPRRRPRTAAAVQLLPVRGQRP